MAKYSVIYGKSGKWKEFDSKIAACKFAVKHPLSKGVIPGATGPHVHEGNRKLSVAQVKQTAKKKVRKRRTRNPLGFKLW